MAVGTYGSKKLADIDFNDADVLYSYSETRNEAGDLQFRPLYDNLTSGELLKMTGADGAYKLRLPTSVFNKLGFYNVLIKPKSYEVLIVDCSYIVSTADDDIQISRKGIVIPRLEFQGSGGLVGYQIEYFDDQNIKVKNFHRIITSNELVNVAATNSQNSDAPVNYVLNPNGNYLFLTLTPDESSLISNLTQADLGKGGQRILISNTFFDPVMLEVEMVDQTIKTLSYGIFGNTTRDKEYGIFSIFDAKNNLYKQYNLLTKKKEFSSGEVDIKQERTVFNFNQSFNTLSTL